MKRAGTDDPEKRDRDIADILALVRDARANGYSEAEIRRTLLRIVGEDCGDEVAKRRASFKVVR